MTTGVKSCRDDTAYDVFLETKLSLFQEVMNYFEVEKNVVSFVHTWNEMKSKLSGHGEHTPAEAERAWRMLYERPIENPYHPNCTGGLDAIYPALRDESRDLELAKSKK